MLRFLCLGILILSCSAPSYARLYVGGKGGLNLSTVSGDWNFDSSGKRIKPGVMIGGIAELPLLKDRALFARAELLYVQKGWKTVLDARDSNGNPAGQITYLTTFHEAVLVALLGVRLPTSGFAPFALIGPEFEYEFAERAGWVHEGDWDSYDESSPPYFNASVNLGIGGALPLSGGELQAELRLNQGLLSRMVKESPWKYRTTCLQICFAYLFPIEL